MMSRSQFDIDTFIQGQTGIDDQIQWGKWQSKDTRRWDFLSTDTQFAIRYWRQHIQDEEDIERTRGTGEIHLAGTLFDYHVHFIHSLFRTLRTFRRKFAILLSNILAIYRSVWQSIPAALHKNRQLFKERPRNYVKIFMYIVWKVFSRVDDDRLLRESCK